MGVWIASAALQLGAFGNFAAAINAGVVAWYVYRLSKYEA